ncbi:MAG: HAD family hydrolase [Clostridiaceae bacterium]
MKINTVIFDLDGTLLDTLQDLCDSVNYIMTNIGHKNREAKEVRSFLGNGPSNLLKKCLSSDLEEEEFAKVLDQYKAYYQINMHNKTIPYPGIIDLLEELKNRGYKLAIVSNKQDEAVKVLAEKYFKGLIDTAAGESAAIKRKPAPDTIYKAIEVLGSKRDEAIYVGDSEVDAKAAKNAGIPCVLVTWGFRDREDLEKEKPDYIIDRAGDLLHILENM